LPTYHLALVDPNDSIWQTSVFARGVVVNARDEETARRQVAALALASIRRSTRRPAAHLPWLFPTFTSCIITSEN
jgi:hypothetical protein